MAINALISYMKIKLESCRTVEFCQNISISFFVLNLKLAAEGALLQTSPNTSVGDVHVLTYRQPSFRSYFLLI